MICSSEKRFFTSNLLGVGNWTPNGGATQNRGTSRVRQASQHRLRREHRSRQRRDQTIHQPYTHPVTCMRIVPAFFPDAQKNSHLARAKWLF
ncbi:hypothetical protein CDO11_05150 [Xanthomonas oryzae pv. oryzae]|nr:hypothetical protein CDO11_05150 [Xanthomonas oryzae pv. oryzae]